MGRSFLFGVADPSTYEIISDVWDGSLRKELEETRSAQRDRNGNLATELNKAVSGGNPVRIAQLKEAMKLNSGALTETNRAISKYNELLNVIQTYTLGKVNIPRLSGLGFAIPAVPIATIVAIGAVAVVANALAQLVSAVRGQEVRVKTYLESIGDIAEGTSHLVRNLALSIFGLGAAFVLFRELKARKKLRGFA